MRDATQSDIDLATFGTASQRTGGDSPASLLSLKDNLVKGCKSKSLPVPVTFPFRRIALVGALAFGWRRETIRVELPRRSIYMMTK